MGENDHLYILWTNGDPITAEKMVFMYGVNSLRRGWWKKVTLIIWGTPAKMSAENTEIQAKIKEALDAGVHITACKACADRLGATEALEALGIDVFYVGSALTAMLKEGWVSLTY